MYDKARRNFGFWDSGLFVAENANQGMICRDADCLLGYAGPLDQQGDVQRNAALALCTILEYPRTPFSLFALFLFSKRVSSSLVGHLFAQKMICDRSWGVDDLTLVSTVQPAWTQGYELKLLLFDSDS